MGPRNDGADESIAKGKTVEATVVLGTGWGEAKITMRFWIIGAMAAAIGLIIGLIGMGGGL